MLSQLTLTIAVLIGQAEAPPRAPDEDPLAPQQTAPSKLDEELLKELSGDLFDDLDGDLFEGLEKPAADDDKKPLDPLDQPLDGEDIGAESNPLVALGEQMRQIEERLAGADTGQQTQRMQRDVAEQLAKLIEEAIKQQQQQQQNQSQSAGQKTAKPGQVKQPGPRQTAGRQPNPNPRESQAGARPGEVQPPDLAARSDLMPQSWGNLPERVRNAIANAADGAFLPEYELLIEEYFRRLAEKYQENR